MARTSPSECSEIDLGTQKKTNKYGETLTCPCKAVPSKTRSGGTIVLQPRVVRFKDAPGYLGMDRNRFNAEVRPYVTEIPIGKQGKGYDRLEPDVWFEDYKSRNGRPGTHRSRQSGLQGRLPQNARRGNRARARGCLCGRKR